MSKELPKQKPTPEVDLIGLFKLIGNAFDRLFKFFGYIVKNLFLAFVWLVFFIKKHSLKFLIAGVLGFILGLVKEKTAEPVYKSFITVKQNYKVGENLYNSISYYNDLVIQKDITSLTNTLNINGSEAKKILGFSIKPVISENDNLQNYNDFLKTLDTAVASKVNFELFIKNSPDNSFKFQQISIKTKERNAFKKVFDKIVENINSNDYFKREQDKDLTELKEAEASLILALNKSDSLQNTYKRVLEKGQDKNQDTQTSITIEATNSLDKTKELELYKSDLELREQLVLNRREQLDKEYILETVSSKQDNGTIDNKITLLGLKFSLKVFFAALFLGLTFIVLALFNFFKYLERYNNLNPPVITKQ